MPPLTLAAWTFTDMLQLSPGHAPPPGAASSDEHVPSHAAGTVSVVWLVAAPFAHGTSRV